jgi:hypothetical protein
MLRDRQPYATRRGFYIGMAVAEVDTEEGPGKDRIGSSLSLDEQSGFIIAVSFSLMRNRNAKLAVIGEAIKLSDPTIAAAREVHMDAFFRLGFDIATAIFGDPAQGAVGNTQPGPWSMKIRDSLLIGRRGGQMAQQGFDDSMKLHLNPPTKWDGLVATGEALAGQDPLTMLLRDQTLGGLLKRGFYIGLALGEKDTEPGKGKDKVRDSLSSTEQMGFVMALNFSLARNRNAKLAATGAAIAAADASIAGLRNLQPNAFYRLGFDVATALFGPPARALRATHSWEPAP